MLSAYHILLVAVVFCLSSLYGYGYFIAGFKSGAITVNRMLRFCILWNCFAGAMMVVLLANNMGILWVALEATTLSSALLILFDGRRASIEAMWKYLLICSMGIAFAFVGILLLSVASTSVEDGIMSHTLLWTELVQRAHTFNPKLMLVAFIFAFIGFGTKAGIAPMHTWLPDAHSQAPTPVSSVFSGVMLSCALYAILRYVTIVEKSLTHGEVRQIILIFGLLSMIVAAVFIISQDDIKRLLAYHSVEHIGIISVGIGLGGFGMFAALFHTLNHSLSKILGFFAAGRLIQTYGTRSMEKMRGTFSTNPVWGIGFFLAVLILIGVAPFAIFMSELQIVVTSINSGKMGTAVIFIVSCAIVFVSALNHAMGVSFNTSPETSKPAKGKISVLDAAIVIVICGLLLLLGIWMPPVYREMVQRAAFIVEGR